MRDIKLLQGGNGENTSSKSGKIMMKMFRIINAMRAMKGTKSFNLKYLISLALIVPLMVGVLFLANPVYGAGGDPIWTFQDDARPENVGTIQEAIASVVDSNGNLIIVGYTNENVDPVTAPNNDDFYIVKVDAAGNFVWRKLYDLTNDEDWIVAVAVDTNDDVIITGFAFNGTNHDIVTIKYDGITGNESWPAPHVFNGGSNGNDYPIAIDTDNLNNIFIAGYSQTGSVEGDNALLYKLSPNGGNPDGTPIWLVEVNNIASKDDRFNDVTTGVDGLAVTGYSMLNHDVEAGTVTGGQPAGHTDQVVNTTQNWAPDNKWVGYYIKMTSGANIGELRSIVASNSTTLTVAPFDSPIMNNETYMIIRQDFDYFTMKIGYGGQEIWQGVYDHGTAADLGYFVKMDTIGNVIITGEVIDATRHDMHTIKYTAAGDGSGNATILWSRTYSGGSPNVPTGLVVDTNDEVYLTGYTWQSMDDFYTARYAADGEGGVSAGDPLVWDQVFHSSDNNSDVAQAIAVDDTGGVYVTGYTHNFVAGDDDFQTIKYNKENGNLLWQKAYDNGGGTEQPVEVAVSIGIGGDGNVYVAGWTDQGTVESDYDYFAVKYDAGLLDPPTGLVTEFISETEVKLTWEDNSNPPNNEDNFCVYRCTGFNCNSVSEITCAVGQDQTTYNDTMVVADKWYSYVVKAYKNPSDYSVGSNIASILTVNIDYRSPTWVYTYDGVDSLDDFANAISVGPDDDPVATGVSSSSVSQYDYYTVKLSHINGSVDPASEWPALYNDPDSQSDMGICLAVDSNSDVIVAGYASMYSGGTGNTNDILTVKYDATGPEAGTGYPLWQDQYAGPGTADDRAEAIDAAVDGSNATVVVGHGRVEHDYGSGPDFNEDIYLIKYKPDYDIAGQQLWAISPYDGGFHDYPTSVTFDSNGDVYIVGRTHNSSNNTDLLINKYSGVSGAQIWASPYTYDSGYGEDGINSIAADNAGNIYVAGYVTNNLGDWDFYINKFDTDGNALWGAGGITMDGGVNGYDEAKTIKVDAIDGEIVVAGTITNVSGSLDYYVARYLPDGSLRWERTLDRISKEDELIAMALSPSGEICLVGDTESDTGTDTDAMAVKYDYLGDLIGSTRYDSTFEDSSTGLVSNDMGEFFVSGFTATGPLQIDDYDFLVFRFNGDVLQAPARITTESHHTTVDLIWEENDPSIDGYFIYLKFGSCNGNTFIYPDDILDDTLIAGTTGYTVSGLDYHNQTYCIGIQSYEGLAASPNEQSRLVELEVTTAPPVAPDTVTAQKQGTTAVEVCWHDNNDTEDDFNVERCLGNCDDTNWVTDLPTLTAPPELDDLAVQTCYLDTTACPGQTYSYRVQAHKTNAWTTAWTYAATMTVTDSLSPPTNFNAPWSTEIEAALLWDDNSVDENYFAVQRCDGSNCSPFPAIPNQEFLVETIENNVLLLGMNGGTWTDDSGNGNDGTVYNSPIMIADESSNYTPDDRYNDGAILLNGSNQYMTTSLTIDQSVTSTGVTMMAWVKPTSTSSNYHYLFSTENGIAGQENNNWGLLRNSSTWYVATGDGVISTSKTMTSGQWQHVAITFEPGVGIQLYVDGSSAGIPIIPSSSMGYHDTSGVFTIGRRGEINQYYFDGTLDEVAVYDRVLSGAEILTLKNRGVFPAGKAWYHDGSLILGNDYTYQVVARKNNGCKDNGWETDPAGPMPINTDPLAPTNVSAVAINGGNIEISWTPTTSSQTGYKLERCNGNGCTPVLVVTDTVGATETKYIDTTFCYNPDGIVRYTVRSLGAWDETLQNPTVAQAALTPGVAPSPLTGLATESQVQLSWGYGSNDYDGFTVLRCEGTLGSCTPDIAVAGSPTLVKDPALLGEWHLDENSWDGNVGEVIDSSGNNNNGTAYGDADTTSPGSATHAAGHAVGTFDGNGDYVDTGVVIDQSSTSSGATFMAWVKPAVNSSSYKPIMGTYNNNNAWSMMIRYDDVYVYNGVSAFYSNNHVLIDQWQHIAVTFAPGVGVTVYNNGVEKTSISQIGHLNGTSLSIGKLGNYPYYWFDGQIDEAMVFSRPLSESEIQAYMDNTYFTAVDNGLTVNTCYTYRVNSHWDNSCNDWDENATYDDVAVCTDLVVEAPSNFTCTGLNTSEVSCSWTPETTEQTGYTIARCEGTGTVCDDHDTDIFVDLAISPDASASSYIDTTACDGKTYTYAIRAEKIGSPAGWPSAWAYIATPASTSASAAPGLTLTPVSESEIDVIWTDLNADEELVVLKRCEVIPGSIDCTDPLHFTTTLVETTGSPAMTLHYRMDESGWVNDTVDIIDISGNNQNGTSFNGADTVVSGKYGKSGYFDGVDDYISTPLNINQNFDSTGLTFESWVYPEVSDGTYRYVISTENGGSDWGIRHYNGTWYIETGESVQSTAIAVDINQWQHVAAVFIPGAGVMFYKNGGLLNGGEEVLVPFINYDSSDNFVFIGRRANGGYHFQGQIDEVMVFEDQLTPAEIASHHTYQVQLLGYQDNVSSCGATLYYKIVTSKGSGDCTVSDGWTQSTIDNVSLPGPPAADNLNITCDSTTCLVEWNDNNGSETGYVVQRCNGPIANCSGPDVWDAEWTGLAADTESLLDDTVCPDSPYSYRIYATTPCGDSAPLDTPVSILTDTIPDISVMSSPLLISEVEIALDWTFVSKDETGLKLERCIDDGNTVDCSAIPDVDLAAGTLSYDDSELTANTRYCYRVAAYKSGVVDCDSDGNGGWQTAWSNRVCMDTAIDPGSLIATPDDTTTVKLDWNDVYETETGTVVERKCNSGTEVPCNGTYSVVGIALPDISTYFDNTACYNTDYTYRVQSEGMGLSNDGGGVWSQRAPINFLTFKPFSGVEIIVNHQAGEMQADFADIRFYDDTGNRELQYWIKEYTADTQATVWLMTGANDNIYIYYGNSAAGATSMTDALFTEVYDDFVGTVIDTDKWEIINPSYVSQNDGLLFTYPAQSQWNTALISTATFERAVGNELYLDITTGAHAYTRYYYMAMGWEKDQVLDPNPGQLLHGVEFYGHHGGYRLYRYENGGLTNTSVLYDDLTHYEMKIVLKSDGAQYYIKGGIYADWYLVSESSSHIAGDDTLRLAFHQYNHNMTIHSVSVKHVSSQVGSDIDFASAGAPPAFTHTWIGPYTLSDDAITYDVGVINDLFATAFDGKVELIWTPVTTDETGFEIERDCGGGFTPIGTSGAGVGAFSDISPPIATSCTYQVMAYKDGACPWTSNPSNGVLIDTPTVAPAMVATALNSFTVRLDWTNSVNEEGYEIEKLIAGGVWIPVVTMSADEISHTVTTGIDPSTTYSFRIRSYVGASYSAFGEASTTTPIYIVGDTTCAP